MFEFHVDKYIMSISLVLSYFTRTVLIDDKDIIMNVHFTSIESFH